MVFDTVRRQVNYTILQNQYPHSDSVAFPVLFTFSWSIVIRARDRHASVPTQEPFTINVRADMLFREFLEIYEDMPDIYFNSL